MSVSNYWDLFIDFIYPIGVFIPLLPLIIGLFRYKRLSLSQKIIVLLVFVASSINIYSSYQGIILKQNNMPSLHLLTLLEFSAVAAYFYTLYPKRLKKPLLISSILFIVFSLFNSLWLQDQYTYNSYARGLESFLLLTYAMVYFLHWISNGDSLKLFQSPHFYMTSGLLFYFSATQFLFLFKNHLAINTKWLVGLAFDVHLLVVIIYYSLLSVGLWKKD